MFELQYSAFQHVSGTLHKKKCTKKYTEHAEMQDILGRHAKMQDLDSEA